MRALAERERFEEAADMRDRAAALAGTLRRQRRIDAVRRAGRLVVEVDGNGGVELAGGLLVRAWGRQPGDTAQLALTAAAAPADDPVPGAPLPRHLADEVAAVAAWLDANAGRARIVSCDGELASALPLLPRFEPAATGPTVAALTTS
jgi:DNA polymerase III subunit epsilon